MPSLYQSRKHPWQILWSREPRSRLLKMPGASPQHVQGVAIGSGSPIDSPITHPFAPRAGRQPIQPQQFLHPAPGLALRHGPHYPPDDVSLPCGEMPL